MGVTDKKVNPLPVLTWNKLDINAAGFEAEKLSQLKAGGELKYPEGIEYCGELDKKGLDEWCRAHGVIYEKETVVAGKYPMPDDQDFPTGLGSGGDEILFDNDMGFELFEIKKSVAAPLRLDMEYEGTPAAAAFLIHLHKGVEFTLILNVAKEDGEGILGHSLRLYLEEGAKLKLVRLQMLPKGFTYFEDAGAWLSDRSELEYVSIQLGAAKVYSGAFFDQRGYESKLYSGLGYIGLKDSFLDHNYVDCFRGKKSQGVMRFNGVLMDNAVKVSRETLDFRQYCTGADGDEEEDLLVLGEDAVNKANPLILGEEEDVSGRHAVTVGRLSQDMLFYMQSRGIDETKAQELMVRSRIMQLAARIPNDDLKKNVERYLDRLYCDRENCQAPCY